MGVGGRDSAGGERHSPGEFGSRPAALRSIKQPLLSVRVSGWAGALVFMGIGGEGNCLCQMKKGTRIGCLLLGADNRT